MKIFIAFRPNDKALDATAAFTEDACRNRFMAYCLNSDAPLNMSIIDVSNVWQIYNQNGYYIKTFEVKDK